MSIRAQYGLAFVLLASCTTAENSARRSAGSPGSTDCIDRDSDGFGEACDAGADCDDRDPKVHEGCLRCATPAEGCECVEGKAPIQCFLDPSEREDGVVMCHEGTRYCRNGTWSGCESIMTYTAPEEATSALIEEDAGLTRCNDCNVLCYRVTDTLEPVDGGLRDSGTNISWVPGGGLTLGQLPLDAGINDGGTTSEVDSDYMCTAGVGPDLDCDGIPNDLDPYPNQTPFATANPSIFLQIGPGETGTGQIDLDFFLNSADVYFLVDQSGSMAEERDQLKTDLTVGDFIGDASYECADYDFDHVPNNELKAQGIVGAIKCKIRDANFGAGFFREIPFSGYANSDQVAFGNYQDVTGNVSDVLAAINRLTTIGNEDWPEASMVTLHNLLTGSGMYFGTTKRGIPARTTCPSGTWGYPCFRSEAVPIVVLFTDAQLHNGPSNNSYAYPASFNVTAGTGASYTWLPATNEAFNGAAVLGDLTTSYKTFSGDTRLMTSDLGASLIGSSCISSSAGRDAVFRFNLTQQKSVTIESTGSHFDTVLGLFTGIPGTPVDLAASANTNEVGASALTLGQGYQAYNRISGNTTSMAADYQWSNVGCDAASASPDAVFKFDVSQTTQIALDTSGSAFDTVLGLYAAVPALPPTYTALATNLNDDYLTAYAAGDVYNAVRAFSGTTAALNADYAQSQVGCGVDSTARDATYSFTLSMPTRVRLSTEGSSFDTVLALYDNLANPVATAAVTGNSLQANAYDTGTLDGRILKLTGTTSSMGADYNGTQIGCSANSSATDVFFKFHLDTPRDVQIDTIGTSGWDPVIGLFTNGNIDARSYTTTANANETVALAQDLGSINGKDLTVTGGSTTSMASHYGSSTVSCVSSSSTTGPDAVYKLRVDADTRVQISTEGSAFDTVLSLRSSSPADTTSALAINKDAVTSTVDVAEVYRKSIVKTGNTSGLTHHYNVGCNAHASAKDAVVTFTLGTATTVQLDTIGTTWDTVLGLYPHTLIDADPTAPAATAVANTYESRTNAYPVGAMDGQWKRFTGSTGSMSADWSSDSSCGAHKDSPDAFYQFSLASAKNVTLSTAGSGFDTVLFLYRYTNTMTGANVLDSCEHANFGDETITEDLVAGTYFVIVKGDKKGDDGNYALSLRDNTVLSNKIACDDNSGGSNTSLITASLAAGTYDVVVSGASAAANGAYSLRLRDVTWFNSFGELQCHDDISGSDRDSRIERDLTAGDYHFIVKGWQSSSKGNYSLRVKDVTSPPVGGTSVACDDNGGGGSNARLVQTALAAGDYWVGLKGRNSSSAGLYTVNIKDSSATASGTALTCDDNTGDSPQSVIERDLQAGTYQVLLKGKAAANSGPYKLSMRDVTNQPISRLACANDGGAGTASYLEQSLAAGTYYAVVKGNAPTDKGAFSLSIRDVTNRPVTSNTCNDNGSTYSTSKITQTLNAGTYYVALKGKNDADRGPYQLSVGAGTTHTGTYVPPTWYDTLAAIQNTQTRVIPILSCQNDPSHGNSSGDCNQARTQATALANASDALGENLQTLVFDINDDGAGLSATVVNAIGELAAYLEMNVSVRVIFEPDDNPGFNVVVKAVDQNGDGCSGLIGVTHQKCVPGATPRFQIEFTNPTAPNNVPLNPDDPNGGYNFRAELLGDSQFVVDHIPVYIIPEQADVMGPPAPQYYPSGEYHQDIASPGCSGNQAPDWRDLDWTADVYGNTSITFKACAARNQADLETCVPRAIAKVTGGADCASSADCPVGYCDLDIGVCQITTAGGCMVSSDCSTNAFCDPGSHLCTFSSQPAYIGTALGELNFNSYLRMSIELAGTQPYEAPPVLHRWEMTYICNQVL
jgi:hypothetical protein